MSPSGYRWNSYQALVRWPEQPSELSFSNSNRVSINLVFYFAPSSRQEGNIKGFTVQYTFPQKACPAIVGRHLIVCLTLQLRDQRLQDQFCSIGAQDLYFGGFR